MIDDEDGTSLEQSIEELRPYINLVNLSFNPYNTGLESLTFRPKNLPKKTPEEEDYHRRIVQENQKRYVKFLQAKQEEKKKREKAEKEKKQRTTVLLDKWKNDILPNWHEYKKNKKKLLQLSYDGFPASMRGRVWLKLLGNHFSITPEFYEISLKKAQSLFDSKEVQRSGRENTINLIELDIDRTFNYLGIFKETSPLRDDLKEVLACFVVSRPDIGYVQGLSFLAGMLLMYMDKFQAFVALTHLVLSTNNLAFFRLNKSMVVE